MKNKTLLIIALSMIPFVVISFSFKDGKTNFNLEENPQERLEEPNIEEQEEPKYTVKVKSNGVVVELDLEEYIVGVVAGEMPASFEMEALKAQAVASRTYALYKKERSVLEYDLTDDTNSQVYITIEDMKNKWGSTFDKYYARVLEAVEETRNEVMTYQESVIEAFYFAMSSGNTQEASSVFNESKDYLKSVESIYDNENLKNYEVTKGISLETFKQSLGLECDNIVVDDINYNESGYVDSISICGRIIKGTTFRILLGLRSTNFDLDIADKVTITTRGYGHGVGMSQYGANGYANAGYTYEDILKHYYTGVEITDIKNV